MLDHMEEVLPKTTYIYITARDDLFPKICFK